MAKIINKEVDLQLIGLDGNAFSLMGEFQRQARKEKWTQDEIDKVLKECKSGDYDHLIATLSEHCVNGGAGPDEDEDWDDHCDYDDEGCSYCGHNLDSMGNCSHCNGPI